ncbi:MAG: transcription antitermination factor NusB [Clostridiales bacterium]|nr:transcription antitermination factor NusB [Clostridiales bacterium]
MSRIKTRELVMIQIYQMDIHNEYVLKPNVEKDIAKIIHDGREITYALKVIEDFIAYKDQIDKMITQSSENWTIDRISKIDLAIIRLSVTEIFFSKNVPDSISINEAILLSKKFSDEDSFKFVNGLLGKIVRSQ